MINSLSALAIALGILAIICYFWLLAVNDRNTQLRAKIGSLPTAPQHTDLQGAALDLMIECEALEARNEWLEWRQVHCQGLVATSIMLAPSRLAMGEKMSIREAQESP